MDPRCISIDIETYGKLSTLPDQTVFTPRRSLYIDGVHPRDLVQSVAITLPTTDPRSRGSLLWSASLLASLKPGQTMVFDARSKRDTHWLTKWLDHADTLFGMNIAFDILYLRAFSPFLNRALSGRHTLIDLSVVNYLQCEVRPERSLKTLGPVLGTHIYKAADLKRFDTWSQLPPYNGADTHNTLVAIAALAHRIDPSTSKLSPFCIDHYSESLWSFIDMSENGVPISRSKALALLATLTTTLNNAEAEALTLGLTLSGHGSAKSKEDLLTRAIDEVEGSFDHNMLTLTEKTRKVSFSDGNRSYIRSFLPSTSATHRLFELVDQHQHAQKLIGSYLYPLLIHKRALKNGNVNRSSLLVPQPGVPYPCPLPLPETSSPTSSSPSPPTSSPPAPTQQQDRKSTSSTNSARTRRRSTSKTAASPHPSSVNSSSTSTISSTTSTSSPVNKDPTNDAPF